MPYYTVAVDHWQQHDSDRPTTFDSTLASAAKQLSRTLTPSLEEIWMFKCEVEPVWAVYVVTRACLDGKLQIGVVHQGIRRY